MWGVSGGQLGGGHTVLHTAGHHGEQDEVGLLGSCQLLPEHLNLFAAHYEMDLLPEELHDTTNRHQRKQSPVLFSHP